LPLKNEFTPVSGKIHRLARRSLRANGETSAPNGQAMEIKLDSSAGTKVIEAIVT